MKATTSSSIAQWRATRPRGAGEAAILEQVLQVSSTLAIPDEPFLAATLDLLDELGADTETLAATIACDAGMPEPPAQIARLVEGQREAHRVWALHRARRTAESAEGLRRLLLAIIGDLRVVFVLLARALARMLTARTAIESS